MAKTKKGNAHIPLVAAGYSLFGLLIVATLFSTVIPFGTILTNPNSIKLNVTVALIALTVGAILPVLVGYLLGEKSIVSKRKVQHHFNGMAFGLLAYWLMTLIGMVGWMPVLPDQNTSLMLASIVPSVIIAIIATLLAILHAKSRQAKYDVLQYTPFVVVLLVCIVALPVSSIVSTIATYGVQWYAFFTLVIVLAVAAISYATLTRARLKTIARVGWTAISVSVLFVTIYVGILLESGIASYFLPYPTMGAQLLGNSIATGIAVVAWVVYWSLQVRALKNAK